jgi:hypothetical protein
LRLASLPTIAPSVSRSSPQKSLLLSVEIRLLCVVALVVPVPLVVPLALVADDPLPAVGFD